MIVLNDEIGAAREIRKVISHRMEKYESGDLLNIGYVDDFGLESCRKSLRKHATATKFDISGVDKLPRVDIIYDCAGAPGDLLEIAFELGKAA